MKIKATSTGTPPLSGAEAFARLLAASMEKKPTLRVVNAPVKRKLNRDTASTVKLG